MKKIGSFTELLVIGVKLFSVKGIINFFAFDPKRQAIILCAGDKTGDEKRFYKIWLPIADKLFDEHLIKLRH